MFIDFYSMRNRAAVCIVAFGAMSSCYCAHASTQLVSSLEDFEGGTVAGAVAVSPSNAPVSANSGTVIENVTESASGRLKISDPDGGVNGAVLTLPSAIPGPGYYLITADVKVDNANAPLNCFGMAAKLDGPGTTELSDLNAGYVMNLKGTTDAASGYQTIGAAVEVPSGGTFPRDLTLYFSTDPSSNTYNAPAADGDFSGNHRGGGSGWPAGSTNAVYVDNIERIGPGNFGEERHLWISVADGYTDLARLNDILVKAKANNFNCIDILARYRADAYYVPNRADATYPNPEPFGTRVGNVPASATNDPLQFTIDRCRELGLKVYISFSCFLVTPNSTYPSFMPADSMMYHYNGGSPRPMVPADVSNEGIWADLTRADVREHTKNVLMDIVSNYDIDGVIFDRIRYPGTSFSYNPAGLAELGYTSGIPTPTDANFREARRDVVTAFIRECYEAVTTKKPWVVVGATPVAFLDSMNDTYNGVFQHWPKWMSAKTANRAVSFGCVDLMQPQFYRLWNSTSPYEAPASNWRLMNKAQFGDVAIFPQDFGLMPGALTAVAPLLFHPNSADANQSNANAQNITDSRDLAMNGWGLFAATKTLADINLIRQPGASTAGVDVLATPSAPNDYLFKMGYETEKPNAPTDFNADVQSRGSVILTWTAPAPAADGDTAAGYYIYKSTTLPVREVYANQINKLPIAGSDTWYHAPVGTEGDYYYKIVAVDDYNNRSTGTEIGPFSVSGAPAAPEDIIVDNVDAAFAGSWFSGSFAADKYGSNYRFASKGTGSNTGTFSFNVPTTGNYDVYEWHSQGSNRAGDAKHIINHAGGQATVRVNQVTNGGKWNKIGTYTFNQGIASVVIDNQFTLNSVVMADAIRLSYVMPPNPTPAAPTGLTANVLSQSEIALSWQDNATDETGYEIERTLKGGETIVIADLPANTSSYGDTNLATDSEYCYVVRAYTSGAQSADSNRVSARTLPEIPPDIIVDNTAATVVGSWSTGAFGAKYGSNYRFASKGNGSRYVQFKFTPARTAVYDVFEWHVAGSNRAVDAPHIVVHKDGAATVKVNQQSNGGKWNAFGRYQFNGGVEYSVTITDQFLIGTVVMADAIKVAYVSEPPTTPAAPSGVSAAVISDTEISLSWVDNAVNETGFEVERTGPDNVPTIVAALGADVVSFDDTGLSADTNYTYVIRAVNAAGKSAGSSPVTARTLPSTPPDVIVDNPAALLHGTWSLGTFAGDKFGTNYVFKGKNTGGFARYSFRTRDLGVYDVYEWHSQGGNRAADARHVITHRAGSSTVVLNQQVNGGRWNKVGTYAFSENTTNTLTIEDKFSIGTVVMADAIKVVWVGELPPVPNAPSQLAATASPTAVSLTWLDNSDDETSFEVLRNGEVVAILPADSTSYSDTAAVECQEYVYTVRAVNLGGASDSSNSVSITIDRTNPTISAPVAVSVDTSPGICGASGVALGVPATADNCVVASVTNDAPETFPVGTTTVTWTVKDAHGNSANATQEVTVTDNEDPAITAPADVTVSTDPGLCSASNVVLGTPVTSDNCEVAGVTNDAPAVFPKGTTTVTWTVTDVHGNTATAGQAVVVKDEEEPVIGELANITLSCSVDLLVPASWEATATDNCGEVTIVSNPASGSGFPVGVTVVTVSATDTAGNKSEKTFTVTRDALTFEGFLEPVGGVGGSADQPVRIAKLGSTLPLKMTLGCENAPVTTGAHKVTIQNYDSVAGMGEAVDATPTDAATTGNEFRLVDAAAGDWHFNWSTKGLVQGSYRVTATLSDGSKHEVWIDLK